MHSKRLRTTEEPVGLDDGLALKGSKKKGSGGPSGPKVRRSVTGAACRKESKQSQSINSSQLSGKRRLEHTSYLVLHLLIYTFFDRCLQTNVCRQSESS